nr:putative ribonuclease H-like domain-containing protein [Tanacetum cinerariifolium]
MLWEFQLFTNCPSLQANLGFWCTAIAYDPNPSTVENKPRPLKEFLIKFTVMNGKKPLTLDFNTFTTSTGLDYDNGAYIVHPSPKAVKAELAKIVLDRNYSSTEQVNSIQHLITYSLITGTKVDIEKIIYSDLDENFGYLLGILSNSNFLKDTSKVTKIGLTVYMIVVNNQKDSVSPPSLSAKKKKRKPHIMNPTLPKSQGLEASGAFSKKKKQPKSKRHLVRPSTGLPSTLDEDTCKSIPLPEGTTTNPKNSGGNDQPDDRDLTFTAFDEGVAKTTSFPERLGGDKDSEGLKPPSTRLRYRSLTKKKSKTYSEVELDIKALQLKTFADVQALLLFDDEMVQESEEKEVFAAREDTDTDTQMDTKAQSPPPNTDKHESSLVQNTNESTSDSSPDLKKFDNILLLTERQLVKYLRKPVAPTTVVQPGYMTGNMSYLSDFEENTGGDVAFSGNPKGGKITGKGKIRTGKLDFDDVYFVKELKFNLFSVSQMCGKKNSILFTDTECIVLSLDLKLPDESHVLRRVSRENNMYNVDLKNIVPSGDLTCLFAKATLDESNLWHRRLGHINFKTMNKLVKGNLVRGLPSKVFENNQTCVACKKGKQHKAFCKSKPVNSVSQPLQRVLVTKPHNKTPYELLLGRTPSFSFLRPFGCPVTILNTLDPLENQPNVAGSGPTWLFDIDTLTSSMNYQLVNIGNQPNSSAGIQELFDAEKQGREMFNNMCFFPNGLLVLKILKTLMMILPLKLKSLNLKFRSLSLQFMFPQAIVPRQRSMMTRLTKRLKEKVLSSCQQELEICVKNLKIFLVDSTNEVNAASTLVFTVRQISTNITNTFSADNPSNIAVSPTLGESSYANPSQYPDDPNMPALEDITYSDDEEDVGAEADFSNLEINITISPILTSRIHKDHPVSQIISDLSYAHLTMSMTRMVKDQAVARIKAIRLFLAYASFMGFMVYQMDVKSAFLYGTIEEDVYVCQPLGFKDTNYPDKVYKVVKALYGLHQAPRAWYETLPKYLLENDFCKAFEKLMKDKFQMSSMGELTFFLGLQVKHKQDGIFISQDKYIAKILRKFGLTDGKSASTPIDTKKPLLKDPDGEDVDVHTYRKSITGGCQFLGCRLIYWQCKKQTVVTTSSTEAEYVAVCKVKTGGVKLNNVGFYY